MLWHQSLTVARDNLGTAGLRRTAGLSRSTQPIGLSQSSLSLGMLRRMPWPCYPICTRHSVLNVVWYVVQLLYVVRILSICCSYAVHMLSVCWPYVVHMLSICCPFVVRMWKESWVDKQDHSRDNWSQQDDAQKPGRHKHQYRMKKADGLREKCHLAAFWNHLAAFWNHEVC